MNKCLFNTTHKFGGLQMPIYKYLIEQRKFFFLKEQRKAEWSELPESCDALRVDDPKLAAFFLVHNLLHHHLDSVNYYFITTKG